MRYPRLSVKNLLLVALVAFSMPMYVHAFVEFSSAYLTTLNSVTK